jgi:hypothetical protein
MKNILLLVLSCLLLSACAKKTYVADSKALAHQLKNTTDSLVNKTSLITDKTVTFISRSIDTNIIITGKALSGYLRPSKLRSSDTSAHFENEDLTLFLHIDKAGNATATSIPKTKTISLKAFEQTAVYNNIVKKEAAKTKARGALEVKTSIATKHTQKETTGNMSFNIILMIILLLSCVFIWIARKFTFLGKLFG